MNEPSLDPPMPLPVALCDPRSALLQPVGKPPTGCIDFGQRFTFVRPVELHDQTLIFRLEMTHIITVHAHKVAERHRWPECLSGEELRPGKENP